MRKLAHSVLLRVASVPDLSLQNVKLAKAASSCNHLCLVRKSVKLHVPTDSTQTILTKNARHVLQIDSTVRELDRISERPVQIAMLVYQ